LRLPGLRCHTPNTVRSAAVVALALGTVLGAGSTTRASIVPAPACSAEDTRRSAIVNYGTRRHRAPLYIRACGPARAVVHFNGNTYVIRGGDCRVDGTGAHRQRSVSVGLITNRPAPKGWGLSVWWFDSRRAGRARVQEAEVQLGRVRLNVHGMVNLANGFGTVNLNRRIRSGTFSLFGARITGSWACR